MKNLIIIIFYFLLLPIVSFGQVNFAKPISGFFKQTDKSGNDDGKNWASHVSIGYHTGLDIFFNDKGYRLKAGEKVYAVLDGVIIYNSQHGGFGGLNPSRRGGAIVIKHKNNYGNYFYAVYGHLNNRIRGGKGTKVKRGQKIGTLNNYKSGNTSNPHLHFGIYTGSNFPSSGWGYSHNHDHLGHNTGSHVNHNDYKWVMPRDYLIKYCRASSGSASSNNNESSFIGNFRGTKSSNEAIQVISFKLERVPAVQYREKEKRDFFSSFFSKNYRKRSGRFPIYIGEIKLNEAINPKQYKFVGQIVDTDNKVLIGLLAIRSGNKYQVIKKVNLIRDANGLKLFYSDKVGQAADFFTLSK